MKLLKLVCILSLTMILCTGCSNLGKNTPENLLDEMPIYNETRKEISSEVKRVLGSSTLILPSNSTDVGNINEIDLNNDYKKETIFFQMKEDIINEDNSKVGFTILDDKNENYDETYIEVGKKIKYANFYDLDNDNNKEIILLVEHNDNITLTICRYEDNKIKTLISKEKNNIFGSNDTFKANILIDDINDDGILDLIVYNYSYQTKNMNIYMMNLKDDMLSILDIETFENVRSFENLNIVIGNISSKQKALFLSIPYSDRTDYTTNIVYLNEDNKIERAFSKGYEKISNIYYIPFEDINNDGITNIPIVDTNSINNYTLNTNLVKSNATITWQKYNGKKDKEADFLFVNQIYYNYEYNFKFLIPNNLVGKIYINEDSESSSTHLRVFKFRYGNNNELDDLFTLNLCQKNIAADNKQSSQKSSENILESDKYVFSITNLNDKNINKFGLNVDVISDYFSKINK